MLAGLAVVLGARENNAIAQPARRRLRRLRRRAIRRFRRRHGPGQLDRARAAVANGEVRPLREVLALIQRRSGAEVLDVDLHETPRGWIYAMRVLTPNGRVRDVYFDAHTLEVIRAAAPGRGDGVPLPPRLDQAPGPRRNGDLPPLPRRK